MISLDDIQHIVSPLPRHANATAHLRAKIQEFRGFDSSMININSKGWNSHVHRESTGKFPESLSQRILVGIRHANPTSANLEGTKGVPRNRGRK